MVVVGKVGPGAEVTDTIRKYCCLSVRLTASVAVHLFSAAYFLQQKKVPASTIHNG
jgi:hypothetical protein